MKTFDDTRHIIKNRLTGSGFTVLGGKDMKKQLSRSIRYVFTFILAVSSFVPMQGSSASRPSEAEFSRGEQDMEPAATAGQASDLHIESGIDHSEYQVIENTDPYLMSLALGTDEPESKYGPKRNLFEEGIPEHAYSPFEEVEKRETCPQGGCDYVEGRVLIKLDAEQVFSKAGTNQVLLQDQELTAALEALEISDLTPVFPNAEPPSPGEMVEAIDGGLVEKPDLTRWLQGETRSTKGMSEVIQQLQKTVGIAVAEPDYIRRPVGEARETVSTSPVALPGPGTDPLFAQQWHLEATNVPEAWAYLESQGLPAGGSSDVIVAVIDTGVDYTHPDLAANMWINQAEFYGSAGSDDDGNGYVDDIYGADTVYPDGDPLDDHGHGTHVAGIIAAQAGNGIGGVGVAYNTRIMAIKAAQYSGILASSDIAEGLYYAVTKGADVINMSFGSYARSTIEEDALTIAFGHAVLVAAAGNDGQLNGPGSLNMFPAAYNWILGVMSRNQYPDVDGNYLSGFSNYDASANDEYEYELMAPGQAIWSTLPGEQYAAWSGTSMSAPVVSGIAALARTKWSDKNIYSSRFIMGQIATTGSSLQGLFELHYNIPDALASITTSPEPKLNYLQHWVFDTQSLDSSNDEDGIVDSGELIDLGIMIRNHWGQTDNVTIRLEPIAESAVLPDPYVTMITDTVVYEPIGSFNWQDNGLIYEGEELVGVEFPFRFTTAPDTPNDHVIPFRLTMTTNNGLDPEDETSYVFEARFYLMVQRGVELPFIIDSDMTLTKEFLWIVSGPTLISEGATLTVTEGTQIEFFGSMPTDGNINKVKPYIQVEGRLEINGSEEVPVEIFPGFMWKGFPVHIVNNDRGYVAISYTKIANPIIGAETNIFGTVHKLEPINHIDHAYLWQEMEQMISWSDWNDIGWRLGASPIVRSETIENTIFRDLIGLELRYSSRVNSSLFDNCKIQLREPVTNSVFLDNYYDSSWSSYYSGATSATSGYWFHEPSFLRTAFSTAENGKTYVFLGVPVTYGSGGSTYFDDSFTSATYLSGMYEGYPVTVNNQEESDFLISIRELATQEAFVENYSDMDCGTFGDCWGLFKGDYMTIGLTSQNDQCEYRWLDGEPLTFTNWGIGQPSNDPCEWRFVYHNGYSNDWRTWPNLSQPIVLELSGTVSDEQLITARQEIINDGLIKDFYNNAILNHWWDTDTDHWLKFKMDKPREYVRNIHENYWGEASVAQVEQAIHDAHDDFNLGVYRYEPILTEAPVTTYPFVVDVVLSTDTQPDTVDVGAEAVTFTVYFNRDMDQSLQPIVSFGPAIPYTDFMISGEWTGPRTWVGSYLVTPVTGNGYQFIRVADAVAADDPWLVTGVDSGRYRFNVIVSGSAAMNLQATGGEGYVNLMWTQTDFDLLSGFHLYRSLTIDGSYTRINESIIPPETRSFRDSDVAPGQPYFYKFTVVKSDMTESDFSNIASATPLDTTPPMLIHTPVTSAEPGQPLTIVATVTDNIAITNVTLNYRRSGDSSFDALPMIFIAQDEYAATIDGGFFSSPGVDYYIEATDGISIVRSGRPENPHRIIVIDKPVVTLVAPNSGPITGGTMVTITGTNFEAGIRVTFGGAAATEITQIGSNQITCITPAHIPETVDVRVTNSDEQYGVLLNGFTFVSSTAQVNLPITGGNSGDIVTVPVNAVNIDGMMAASFTVNFDPNILFPKSASTGTLTSGWAFASNLIAPGKYRISMSSINGVEGVGTLANIDFEVVGAPGTSSPLTITDILLNDGAIGVQLMEGLFSVDNVYSVTGLVSYWNKEIPVSGTILTLSGVRQYTVISGTDGIFTFPGAVIDSYELVPEKSTGENGITAFDASFVLRHDVGLITLSGNQALAADVNSNGEITAMDAAYVLQKSAGLIGLPFPGSGVAWKFEPASRNIPELTGNVTGQDFTAILLGDVSGNWSDPGEGLREDPSEINAGSATLTIPAVTTIPGGSIDVPINLEISDAQLLGANITFTFDPIHVSVSNVRIGSAAIGWTLVSNLNEPGVVRIAMAGVNPIAENGQLVQFTVTALGEEGSQSDLTFTMGELNEGAIMSILIPGSVYIETPVQRRIFIPLVIR